MKAAMYTRVAGAKGSTSLEQQQAELKAFAEQAELETVEMYQEICSGLEAFAMRVEGKHLLEDAQAGKFRLLLVLRPDRLSRDIADLTLVSQYLSEYGVEVRYLNAPEEHTIRNEGIMQLLLAMEREHLIARMQGGKEAKRQIQRKRAE